MNEWPQYPTVYEINTWAWLTDLSRQAEGRLTLADVPQAELERIASYGFDGVWLMGVWQRSPGARRVALTYPGWQEAYRHALPDLTADDVVGSPYAIRGYDVDPSLGGDDGLASLRARLQDLGLRLILDFVPNHMALDHSWLGTHRQRLVQSSPDRLAQEPANYFQAEVDGQACIFAHGRDPYFDGWPDTVQIDHRLPDTRRAMSDLLLSIAGRCDGVRCDMAMLLTRDVFLQTWGGSFDPAAAEFWPAAITDLKALHPRFLTMAEVYWDMEWVMQQQGFDYTYDKRLYDRLLHGDASSVHAHLTAGMDYQQHLARFIENHDERRATEAFGVERSKAAAVLALTLPGLRLIHEGQLEGRQVKLPVHLGRRRPEGPVEGLEPFYRRLLAALSHPVFHDGAWKLLETGPKSPGDPGYQRAVGHQWILGEERRIVAVNLSEQPAQFFLPVDMPKLADGDCQLRDLLSDEEYTRSGGEMLGRGLYVDLMGFGAHIFEVR
jgi:glycosidase